PAPSPPRRHPARAERGGCLQPLRPAGLQAESRAHGGRGQEPRDPHGPLHAAEPSEARDGARGDPQALLPALHLQPETLRDHPRSVQLRHPGDGAGGGGSRHRPRRPTRRPRSAVHGYLASDLRGARRGRPGNLRGAGGAQGPATRNAGGQLMKGKLGGAMTNVSSVKELLGFVWRGRAWWLTPLVLRLALMTFIVSSL